MDVCDVYVRDGVAFLPTVARTTAGFWMDVEPVEVVPFAAAETAGLCAALARVIDRGNPTVPTPTRATFPPWVVLRHAGVASARAFGRTAAYVHVESGPDGFEAWLGTPDGRGGWTPGRPTTAARPSTTATAERAVALAGLIRQVIKGGRATP